MTVRRPHHAPTPCPVEFARHDRPGKVSISPAPPVFVSLGPARFPCAPIRDLRETYPLLGELLAGNPFGNFSLVTVADVASPLALEGRPSCRICLVKFACHDHLSVLRASHATLP